MNIMADVFMQKLLLLGSALSLVQTLLGMLWKNIEARVLISGGSIPGQLNEHFFYLIKKLLA